MAFRNYEQYSDLRPLQKVQAWQNAEIPRALQHTTRFVVVGITSPLDKVPPNGLLGYTYPKGSASQPDNGHLIYLPYLPPNWKGSQHLQQKLPELLPDCQNLGEVIATINAATIMEFTASPMAEQIEAYVRDYLAIQKLLSMKDGLQVLIVPTTEERVASDSTKRPDNKMLLLMLSSKFVDAQKNTAPEQLIIGTDRVRSQTNVAIVPINFQDGLERIEEFYRHLNSPQIKLQ
ncbi:hypothetical protein HY041_00010 [Candidatus Roizmanbacteria bacterium]|nr:hypothetical protein [Candidatus Roizmanbacteria bacterium]